MFLQGLNQKSKWNFEYKPNFQSLGKHEETLMKGLKSKNMFGGLQTNPMLFGVPHTSFQPHMLKHRPNDKDDLGITSILHAPSPHKFTYDFSPLHTLNIQGKVPSLEQIIVPENETKEARKKAFDDMMRNFFDKENNVDFENSSQVNDLIDTEPLTMHTIKEFSSVEEHKGATEEEHKGASEEEEVEEISHGHVIDKHILELQHIHNLLPKAKSKRNAQNEGALVEYLNSKFFPMLYKYPHYSLPHNEYELVKKIIYDTHLEKKKQRNAMYKAKQKFDELPVPYSFK